MKSDYWNVNDAQVIEKTGKRLADWDKILAKFNAVDKKSTDVVRFLQVEHGVARYWARTLTTRFLKQTPSNRP